MERLRDDGAPRRARQPRPRRVARALDGGPARRRVHDAIEEARGRSRRASGAECSSSRTTRSSGRRPLCIEPALFGEHAAAIAASGAVLTVCELGRLFATARCRSGPSRSRSTTGARASHERRPVLAGTAPATVFCVAGHLGDTNDWPSSPRSVAAAPLLGAAELAALAGAGWEIGSHGVSHRPLGKADAAAVGRDRDSRERLAELTGAASPRSPTRTAPFPACGASPRRRGLRGGARGAAPAGRRASAPYLMPRVDAHYLRRKRPGCSTPCRAGPRTSACGASRRASVAWSGPTTGERSRAPAGRVLRGPRARGG